MVTLAFVASSTVVGETDISSPSHDEGTANRTTGGVRSRGVEFADVPDAGSGGDALTDGTGEDLAGKVARLYLLGPMRLLDERGHDFTPKGSMRRALLAILALSRQGTKARVKLQDLLWSCRGQEQGSQSLRTTLSLLKRELSALPVQLLEANQQVVRLDKSRLWIDVFEYEKATNRGLLCQDHGAELPDLLEGLNIRASRDERFEEWLRDERRHWGERLERLLEDPADWLAVHARTASPVSGPARSMARGDAQQGRPVAPSPFGIGLLPTVVCAPSQWAPYLGNAVLVCVPARLRDVTLADAYAYSDSGALEGFGPAILPGGEMVEGQDRLMLALLAYAMPRAAHGARRPIPKESDEHRSAADRPLSPTQPQAPSRAAGSVGRTVALPDAALIARRWR